MHKSRIIQWTKYTHDSDSAVNKFFAHLLHHLLKIPTVSLYTHNSVCISKNSFSYMSFSYLTKLIVISYYILLTNP